MIGLDTNVLVRTIMRDDHRQSPLATRLVESLSSDAPGFVPLGSIIELVWVLGSAYPDSQQFSNTIIVAAHPGPSKARRPCRLPNSGGCG